MKSKVNMKTIFRFFVIFICLLLTCFVVGQDKKIEQPKNVRIDKGKPSAFITFEKRGKRPPLHYTESNEGIWLRFHNNSIWDIKFCVYGVSDREYGDYTIPYKVGKLERWKWLKDDKDVPIGYYLPHTCNVINITSGKSFSFSILSEALADGLEISVRFYYSWEDSIRERNPQHLVYFSSDDLPPDISADDETSCAYRMNKIIDYKNNNFAWLNKVIGQAVHCVPPKLPSGMNVKGIIEVDVWTDANGNVMCAQAPKGNKVIRQIAEEAVRQWKFVPFKREEKPIGIGGTITLFYGNIEETSKQCSEINQHK